MLPDPPMKNALYALLDAHGLRAQFDGDPCFYAKFELPCYTPLVIERLALCNEISIAHCYVLNGDVMRDPEIVFDAHWRAVEITQDNFASFEDFRDLVADGGRAWDVEALAATWAKNLLAQGWETAVRTRPAPNACEQSTAV